MKQIKQEIMEEFEEKFKSPLGYSSIDNKNNSMFDLEQFLSQAIDKAVKQALEGVELEEDKDCGSPDNMYQNAYAHGYNNAIKDLEEKKEEIVK